MDDLSCNHMICAVCGANFCWLCLKEMSDLHYLSLSGCTFWGRRPWSRKKKILCQLGTLIGAPVGIPVVAGLAVPAIIIGIPIWIGQKIYFRYKLASKHKRNLATTSGVVVSLLAAPIIAGLIVGLGVPALLVYVYGVVPVSLCRSQGCGVTTNTSGVRFEFDEQGEGPAQGPHSYAGDNQSVETVPHVANPSIAPSIGDASLGMTNSLSASGSHMERAGVLRDDSDRDSASHRAIAGNSINGSLCSATYSAQHHKLEVQADILELAVHCEKSSMGGESYNVSLNDDASTRALAGSIISPKDKDGVSLCSRHFDGASVAYSEERADVECEPSVSTTTSASAISANSSKLQRTGSTSCPSSPRLSSRKGTSPAPSTEENASHGGSYRGKKCTRFMDQVAEIEVGVRAGGAGAGDSHSVGSGNSNSSNSEAGWERREGAALAHTSTSQVWAGPDGHSLSSLSEASGLKKLASSEEEGVKREGLGKKFKSTGRASSFDIPSKSLSMLKPSPSLTSTSSLSKASRHKSPLDPTGESEVGACSCSGSASGRGCSGVRVKAESTSTLVDGGAESRRTEMGGSGRRKSDSTCWRGEESSEPQLHHLPPGYSAGSEHALGPASSRRGLLHRYGGPGGSGAGGAGNVGDKPGSHIHQLSHLSQPSNLWDISELQAGMLPRLQHTVGCSDMLAVVSGPEGGVSCESVFLDKMAAGRPHHHCLQHHNSKLTSCHLMSTSSSGSFSSTDEQSDFIPSSTSLASVSSRRRGPDRPFDTYETLPEDVSPAKTSTMEELEETGNDLPATISTSTSLCLSSSLLKAHSDRKASAKVSSSDIQVECPTAGPNENICAGEEKASVSSGRLSSKLSLQGYLSSLNDAGKERAKKSPSLMARRSIDAADATSLESESLLEPSVSEASSKRSSKTSIRGEVAAAEKCAAPAAAPSYLPDVEMPAALSPSRGRAGPQYCTHRAVEESNARHCEHRVESSEKWQTSVVMSSTHSPSGYNVSTATASDLVRLAPPVSGGESSQDQTDHTDTSCSLAPVLPVEEMLQVYTSADHRPGDKDTPGDDTCTTKVQEPVPGTVAEESSIKLFQNVLNTSL